MRLAILFAALLLPCTEAWIATAQLWPSNYSNMWRPEEIAMRGGALSALWPMPET